MMEKTAKIKLFILLLVVGVAVGILAKVYMSATSPSSVKLTVYKLELMTGASDTNPQVFFSERCRSGDRPRKGHECGYQAGADTCWHV